MAGNPCYSLCCKFEREDISFWPKYSISAKKSHLFPHPEAQDSHFPFSFIRSLLIGILKGLILLFLIAWPIAAILAPFWLLLLPFESCCSLFADINGFLEKFVVCKWCIHVRFFRPIWQYYSRRFLAFILRYGIVIKFSHNDIWNARHHVLLLQGRVMSEEPSSIARRTAQHLKDLPHHQSY